MCAPLLPNQRNPLIHLLPFSKHSKVLPAFGPEVNRCSHSRPSCSPLPFPTHSKVLPAIGKEVKEFFGGHHSTAALTATTGVIVCTIEKANIM